MVDLDFNIKIPARINPLWRKKAPPFPSGLEGAYDQSSWRDAPAEYNLCEVALSIHPSQQDAMSDLRTIVDHLERTGGLQNCLGLNDAIEIQRLGPEKFRELYGAKVLLFLRDVAKERGSLDNHPRFVPCLYIDTEGELRLVWCPLEHYANNLYATLSFECGLCHLPAAA